jgi:hypothetical protein
VQNQQQARDAAIAKYQQAHLAYARIVATLQAPQDADDLAEYQPLLDRAGARLKTLGGAVPQDRKP